MDVDSKNGENQLSGKGEVVIEKSSKTVSKFKPEIKVCETLTPNQTNT